MDQQVIVGYVVAATEEVCSTMLGTECVAQQATQRQSSADESNAGLRAFVGLAGSWYGMGCLSLSADLACRLSGQLLMSEYTAVDDEVLDAVAEIANMVVGNIKNSLENDLGPMGLSVPTVIYGRNLTTRAIKNDEWLVVPFQIGDDVLEVQICLAPQPGADPATRRRPETVSLTC